jgi:FtsH-binding integral membrane protein
MGFAVSSRSIEGAVATLGVSDRISFLRRTYAHLGVALLLFAGITGALFKFAPALTWKLSTLFGTSMFGMLGLILILVLLMGGSEWLASHSESKAIQYAGLLLGICLQVFMLLPLIWLLMLKFGKPADMIVHGKLVPVMSAAATSVLVQAVVITLTIFIGLTLVVFITKKDFSFMRGGLVVFTFALLGVGLASIMFGFSLGMLFAGLIVLLMAGYILYETSVIMKDYPPTAHVAAALTLFVTVATMFRAILRILIALRD